MEHSIAVVKARQYQTTGKHLCELGCQQMANTGGWLGCDNCAIAQLVKHAS